MSLFHKIRKEECGYTLIEVVVSIIILSLAILPMAGMFDMAIGGATSSSNYDKSRTLANLKLEVAKSLPFSDVKDNFPLTGTTYSTTGHYDSGWRTDAGQAYWDNNFTNFQYKIEKQYMKQPSPTPGSPSEPFSLCDTTATCTAGTKLIRVTVKVKWGDGNEYTTFGLRAQ